MADKLTIDLRNKLQTIDLRQNNNEPNISRFTGVDMNALSNDYGDKNILKKLGKQGMQAYTDPAAKLALGMNAANTIGFGLPGKAAARLSSLSPNITYDEAKKSQQNLSKIYQESMPELYGASTMAGYGAQGFASPFAMLGKIPAVAKVLPKLTSRNTTANLGGDAFTLGLANELSQDGTFGKGVERGAVESSAAVLGNLLLRGTGNLVTKTKNRKEIKKVIDPTKIKESGADKINVAKKAASQITMPSSSIISMRDKMINVPKSKYTTFDPDGNAQKYIERLNPLIEKSKTAEATLAYRNKILDADEGYIFSITGKPQDEIRYVFNNDADKAAFKEIIDTQKTFPKINGEPYITTEQAEQLKTFTKYDDFIAQTNGIIADNKVTVNNLLDQSKFKPSGKGQGDIADIVELDDIIIDTISDVEPSLGNLYKEGKLDYTRANLINDLQGASAKNIGVRPEAGKFASPGVRKAAEAGQVKTTIRNLNNLIDNPKTYNTAAILENKFPDAVDSINKIVNSNKRAALIKSAGEFDPRNPSGNNPTTPLAIAATIGFNPVLGGSVLGAAMGSGQLARNYVNKNLDNAIRKVAGKKTVEQLSKMNPETQRKYLSNLLRVVGGSFRETND
jgi:hypothetical protein